jgi:hypothetical protein
MSPQEKAAIVSGIFTFIGGLITFFLMKYYEQRQLLPVGGARRNALCGNWKGQITQRTVGSYEVEMSLQSKGNKIIGKGWLRHIERNLLITLEMEGGFLYENFLKLDYKNSDSAHIQFGSMVFEVSPCSKKIKGKFSGYGSVSKAVVGGDISLEKNPS